MPATPNTDTANLAGTSPDRPDPDNPTSRTHQPRHTGRAERALAAALPVVLAAGVFAVAFAHVHDVARWAGQPDWAAWLVAVSVELMALASIVEIRHRHRLEAGVGWPVLTFVAGIAMSGASNLAAAGTHALTGPPGPWTTVMALWPVAAFGLVAGLKATRPTRDYTAPQADERPDNNGQLETKEDPGQAKSITDPPTPHAALPADLVAAGLAVAAELTKNNQPLTRTALARGVRDRGHRCSTDRAARLLATVQTPATAPTDVQQPSAAMR